jgi:hypothetical protein
MELFEILTQYSLPGGIMLDLPNVGGWFSGGLFSAIGQGMFIFLALMVVIWIGFAIYGAFSIISSFGDPQKIEKGWKTIKSVWIGISYFLLFFAVIGLIAVFLGVGAPWRWAENLQQCSQGGPAAGRFYFLGNNEPDNTGKIVRKSYMELLDEFKVKYQSERTVTANVFCCENGDRKYFQIERFSTPAPSNCKFNSSSRLWGPRGETCKPGGRSCGSDSECCSGNCLDSGGGMRCAY